MQEVSETSPLDKIKALLYSGQKESLELAMMLVESNKIDLSSLEIGIKTILKVAKLQPRLGQWAEAKMENFILPLGIVLALSIEECELAELPAEIGLFRNLGIIELHQIELEKLPAEIQFLQNLRSLSIKHNRLTHLPAEIGQLSRLKSLNLHDNQLRALPDSMQQLEQLELLELSKNPYLTELPAWTSRLPALKRLVLDAAVFGGEVPASLLPLPAGLQVEWQQILPRH